MSNECTCDNCLHAREVKDEEIAYGTHWCKSKEEYVQCYINCNDWIDINRCIKDEEEPDHDLEYHDKKCEEENERVNRERRKR